MLEHLGVIADGNRRWAKERGLPTIEGHRRGLDSIEQMVIGARDAGIKYITFYVFSTVMSLVPKTGVARKMK